MNRIFLLVLLIVFGAIAWLVFSRKTTSTSKRVEKLTLNLEDKNLKVRIKAAKKLGEMGPAAKDAAPALAKALKHASGYEWQFCIELVNALGKIGPDAKDAVPILIESMKSENMDIVSYAATVLGKIGPVAIPSLIKALKDENKNARWFAAEALGNMGSAAKDAIPALNEALESESTNPFYVEALKKIQGNQ